ncbi:MAG: S8/S53 family peptidase [Acidobacteriia bacterium]|nr:S8/S53 family peptidase [Terriglobia bacterium]
MFCYANLFAQPDRITQPIDDSQVFTIPGNLPPLALSQYDQGPLNPSLKLARITLVVKPSDAQAAALDTLLTQLHDPKSSTYHNWLTPESYANQFGLSQSDIAKIVEWLTEHELAITSVARARNAITVSGTVDRIQAAFQTQIHTFVLGSQTYYANASPPSLPAAFQGIILAIHGLHNFRLLPQNRMLPTPLTLRPGATPHYTSGNGTHYLAPNDFATIFNIKPLYSAGIDGSNQTIVIVGQSDIDTSHLSTFRSYFSLSAASLTTTLVPDSDDPGYSERDAQESDLDLEWASGVAKNATLQFVYASDVTDAAQYAIDENLAPVLSMSYGMCETSSSQSDALTMQTWAKQGNTQGITWVASSGDSGAAACYGGGPNNALSAAVNAPADIPEVTAIGGTEFNEAGGTYWSSTNDSNTKASAQSYIPETSWNDSTTDSPAASGGGASQFFSKPSWQTGAGVPSDGVRDVPDLAFPASADHDGYMVYTTSGLNTGWSIFGGTSAGAPSFSGILALLNQYLVTNGYQSSAGLGNINSQLYSMAASSPSAFHDITTGNNNITASCIFCSSPTQSVGYPAGTGYDQVTGLGSLDVHAFFAAWQN